MRLPVLVALLLLPAGLAAQEHADHAASPYADLQARDIKALPAEEVEGLLAGEGMGFALTAELNGYPGPRHVLELADSLALTDEQRQRVDAVMAEMGDEARRLGARLVEAERALDRSFADGTVREEELSGTVADIAALRGTIRAVHLGAHLRMVEILTPHQRHRYQQLRGYGDGHAHPMEG